MDSNQMKSRNTDMENVDYLCEHIIQDDNMRLLDNNELNIGLDCLFLLSFSRR